MNRAWTLFRRITAWLMLVAVMAFTLHASAMAESANGADLIGSVPALSDHGHLEAKAASLVRHGHNKSPCKSACCGVTCTLAMPVDPSSVVLPVGTVTLIALPRIAVLEGLSSGGLRRPPRPLLNV